jgi:hypothetical protein
LGRVPAWLLWRKAALVMNLMLKTRLRGDREAAIEAGEMQHGRMSA